MTRAVYKEWFPQVWLDEHQMGSNGPRIFVPPYSDPGGHGHPSARLARGQPHRIQHGAAPRAGRQVRRHLRLLLRRLLAGRHEEHRLVQEHLRPPDGGRLGAHGHADRAAAGRARGRAQGTRSSTARRPTSPTRGPAGAGACATSWTTSGSRRTRCSRPAPTRREDFLRDMVARARFAIAAFRRQTTRYRIPAAAARPPDGAGAWRG